MVPGKSQMSLLEIAEASLVPRRPFYSLDDLLKSFGLTRGSAQDSDAFVRTAVWNLSEQNRFCEGYKLWLLGVEPHRSAHYLVGALGNSAQRTPASEVLLDYGSCRAVVEPLVGALAVNPAAPHSSEHVAAVVSLLSKLGPNRITIGALAQAITNPERYHGARAVLLAYGQKALKFICHPPKYGQLAGVVTAIKAETVNG